MQVKVLLLFVLFIPASLSAQITLSSNDFPGIGDSWIIASDTLIVGLDVGSAGPDQVWDLTAMEQDLLDTTEFVDPATTPFGDDFPNANLSTAEMGFFSYNQVTSDHALQLGAAGDISGFGEPLIVKFEPPQTLAEFPLGFGNSFSSEHSFEVRLGAVIPGSDSVRFSSKVERDMTIDGWGEVQTPAGNFESLRQKADVTTTDSAWIYLFGSWVLIDDSVEETTEYSWLAKETQGGAAVVTIEVDGSINGSYTVLQSGGNAPVADFTYNDMGNGSVEFTDQSSNNPTEWQWDFGDGTLSDEQNPTHAYASSGTYNACLTAINSAGSDTECQDVSVIISSTKDVYRQLDVEVFPNPADDLVHFQIPDNREAHHLIITDLLGRVALQTIISNRKAIDVSSWAPGHYLFQVKDKQGRMLATGQWSLK